MGLFFEIRDICQDENEVINIQLLRSCFHCFLLSPRFTPPTISIKLLWSLLTPAEFFDIRPSLYYWIFPAGYWTFLVGN